VIADGCFGGRRIARLDRVNDSAVFQQRRFASLAACAARRLKKEHRGMDVRKHLQKISKNPGRVIARDELLNQVWGYENYPCTRTVGNHILRLRKKLERRACRPLHFRTVHGVGYKFLP